MVGKLSLVVIGLYGCDLWCAMCKQAGASILWRDKTERPLDEGDPIMVFGRTGAIGSFVTTGAAAAHDDD